MLVINKIADINSCFKKQRLENKDVKIGFVPTMGTLHEGHISLINASKSENTLTVCSIYVNPLQFNDEKDFENYPRNYDNDIEILKKTDCDVVFIPGTDEMLPEGDYPHYDLAKLDKVMEGKYRPGHFRGVVYIVNKLFEIVEPDNAYFGLKDYQQYLIIKHFTEKSGLKINIIGCPIIREKDGLALSSRNLRLSEKQRNIAPVIYSLLQETKREFETKSIDEIKLMAAQKIHEINNENRTDRSLQLIPDYFEIADRYSLEAMTDKQSGSAIACIALFLGDIRLIDNILF